MCWPPAGAPMTARPPRRAGQLAQPSTGLILQIHHTLTQLHTPNTADRKFSINTSHYCWFQSHVLWLHLFIISIYFTFDLDNLPFHIQYSLSNMKWIEMYITFCWPFNSLKYLLIGNIFNKKYLREDNKMHSKERSVFTLTNFYECDIGKQLTFFSKLSIADLGPDKYELITETGSHFSKKHHSHHT